jgi:hypothetical protein
MFLLEVRLSVSVTPDSLERVCSDKVSTKIDLAGFQLALLGGVVHFSFWIHWSVFAMKMDV